MTQTWEYLVLEHDVDVGELNKNGAAGWELVSVVPCGKVTSYYFKRPIGERAETSHEDQVRRDRAALRALRAG